MNHVYLITFEPAGRYYFGTSQSFADSFYARSSLLPTQTMLLGCLRYTILKQKNLLDKEMRYPKSIDEVQTLTGEAKMTSISDTVESGNYFGIIKKISPVFVCRQPKGQLFPQNFYFPVPFDVIYIRDNNRRDETGNKEIIGVERILFEKVTNYFSVRKRTKEYTADLYGGNLFWKNYIDGINLNLTDTFKKEKIFTEDSHPGIRRYDGRKTEESAYYIKKDFRLKKEFSLGIIVHCSQEFPLNESEEDVYLGGERSLFRMKLTKIDDKNIGVLNAHIIIKGFLDENYYGDYDGSKQFNDAGSKGIVFLSPFFGKGKIRTFEHSVINHIYSPRILQFRGGKTNTFNVIPDGSVLYLNNKLPATDIFNIPKLIGYNYAIKFN